MKEIKELFADTKALKITLLISVIYVLPLVVADYDYLDDYRRNLYGYGWQHDGRFIASLCAQMWSLNSLNFSIYPYSTILSALILGFTGYLLAYFFNIEKDQSIKWSSLLIVTMPTFLGNLVFKFDCLPMALSLLTIVAPFLFFRTKLHFFIASIIGVFLSLGLYQSGSTAYFIVGSLFLIQNLLAYNWRDFFSYSFLFITSFLLALLGNLLLIKAFKLPVSTRLETILGSEHFFEQLKTNHDIFLQRLDLLLNSGNYMSILFFFGVVTIMGLVYYSYQNRKNAGKILVIVPVLLILIINVYLISSVNILLKETYWDFRSFCGLGFVLFNLVFFQNYLKGYFMHLSRFAIFLLVVFSFTLMAQFGRILTNQNQFQQAIAQSLAPHLQDGTVTKVGFIGTLRIAPKNEFAYKEFPLFTNLLSSPVGQFSAWTFDALNINGMLKNTEIIATDYLKCTGVLIEKTKYYYVREINQETLIIDFEKNQCD